MSAGNLLLTVSEPGWRDKRDVQVVSVAASWEVSTLGLLSAKLPAKRAHLLGIGEWLGKWVRADLGRQGIWGGIIQRNPTETSDGTMELSCDSFHALFDGIATAATYRQASASAGALWLRAIADAPTNRTRWISSIRADEDGPSIAMEWRGDDLYDLSGYLADTSDHEWDVVLNADWTISAVFRKRVGRDRRGRVLLIEGRNGVSGQVAPSRDDLVNVIRAHHEEEQWETSPVTIAIDARSRQRYEEITKTRSYAAMTGPESLYIRAKQDLARESVVKMPTTVIVPASDRQLSDVRQGDTVRYWSARQNKRGDLRIISRSIDVSEGTVKLAGDFVEAS